MGKLKKRLKRRWFVFRKARYTLELEQGERGKWRWYLRQKSDNALIAQSSVGGFDTESEARLAAYKTLSIRLWEIEAE